MAESKYDLALLEWEAPPVAIAVPIVAKATGLTPIDVSAVVRRSQGVLCRDVDEEKARQAVEEFKAQGIKVEAVPSGTLVDLPHAWPMKEADLLPECFRPTTDVYGNQATIPWSEVAVVTAASITTTVRGTKMEVQKPSLAKRVMFYGAQVAVIGLPLVRLQPTTVPHTYEEQAKTCVVSFVAVNPLRHFRAEAGQFNYMYLGERLSESSAFNFAALVTDALRWGGSAATNLSPEEMKGVATHWPVYESAHDLERRMAWMLWRWESAKS